jgi:asparagine synthase (glutamine-hydrolysing)
VFRYVSYLWDTHDSGAEAEVSSIQQRLSLASSPWEVAFQSSGFVVSYKADRGGSTSVVPLAEGAGVLLGTLFLNNHDQSKRLRATKELEPSVSRTILDSGGRSLVKSHWGRYVAFLGDPNSGRRIVFRGPVNDMPCFTAQLGTVTLYFSHLQDYLDIKRAAPSIDWRYIEMHLVMAGHSERTGISDVSEVRAGTCVEHFAGARMRNTYWDPLVVAQQEPFDCPTTAASALRSATRLAVQSWAACHKGILINLSGGLDSSIVVASLGDFLDRPRITCANQFSAGAVSDERPFARLVAQMHDLPLIEEPRDSDLSLDGLLRIPRTARPENYVMRLERTRREAELARSVGASAVFCGSSGDEVFFSHASGVAVADYMHRHGVDSRLIQIAINSAERENLSIWDVLTKGARAALRPQWDPLASYWRYQTLLAPELQDSLRNQPSRDRTWITSHRGASIGLLRYIMTTSTGYEMFNPLGLPNDPEQVAPLFSQPVIEIGLRIPSYVFEYNGFDRALARLAFSKELPDLVLRRASKGMVEEHLESILFRNLTLARELVLDGELARRGYLNVANVEDVLSGHPSAKIEGISLMLSLLSTEAWLHQFH